MIRVRVRLPGEFRDGTFRTITISKDQGITSVIGRLKTTGKIANQNFMFRKDKDWTKASASKWVRDHGYTIKSIDDKEETMACKDVMVAVEIIKHGADKDLIVGANIVRAVEELRLAEEIEGKIKERVASVPVMKINAPQHKVMGVVYAPNTPDSYDDFMTAEQIEKMSDFFMVNHRNVDEMHDRIGGVASVTQSFLARKGDPDFPEGAWVVETKVHDNNVWKKLIKGEYKAFSFSGSAKRGKTVEMETRWRDEDGNWVNAYGDKQEE